MREILVPEPEPVILEERFHVSFSAKRHTREALRKYRYVYAIITISKGRGVSGSRDLRQIGLRFPIPHQIWNYGEILPIDKIPQDLRVKAEEARGRLREIGEQFKLAYDVVRAKGPGYTTATIEEQYVNETSTHHEEKKMVRVPQKRLGLLMTEFYTFNLVADSTKRAYSVTKEYIYAFNKEQFGIEDVRLIQYDLPYLMRFTVWLRKQKKRITMKKRLTNQPLSLKTIKLYMEKFCSMLNFAVEHDYLEVNPFNKYDMSKLDTVIKHTADMLDRKISRENLRRIEASPLDDPKMERTRLIFLFQRWTGMAWADLNKKDIRKCIKTDRDDKTCVMYNREKNGQLAIVPLFSETEALLKRLDYYVNPGSYTTYYTNIKALFDHFGLQGSDEDLGTHTGRHVFGSEMLEMGMTIESVSRMMGHATTEETQRVYAKINSEKIFSDLNKINNVPRNESREV